MDLSAAVAVALVVGATLGLLGAGGSIVTVPALIYLVDVAPESAVLMSLVVVGCASTAGVVAQAPAGNIALEAALPVLCGGVPGALAGTLVSQRLPSSVLMLVLALVMVLAGAAMMRGPARELSAPVLWRTPVLVLCGLLVGGLTGLVGVGGGFLFVPALVVLGGLPMQRAVGTSLLLIAVNALVALLGRGQMADVDPGLTFILAAGGIAGSLLGVRVGAAARPRSLRRAFAAVVLVVAGLTGVRGASQLTADPGETVTLLSGR